MDPGNASSQPKHHPDCCLAISQQLLETLANILPRSPSRILSIGSGTGFLEASLLNFVGDSLDLCGVEVSPHVNKYLPEQNIYLVSGTWDLQQDAVNVDVWLFVYPREPRLLSSYIERLAQGRLQRIVWLGPRMDWQDYEPVFTASKFNNVSVLENSGTAEYEMISVASRT